MSGKLGVQNLKEILDVVLDGYDLGKAVLADGKVAVDDLDDIVLSLPKLGASVQAAIKDVAQIIPEAKDLQAEELTELGAHIIARLGGTDQQKAVRIAAKALKVAGAALELVQEIKS